MNQKQFIESETKYWIDLVLEDSETSINEDTISIGENYRLEEYNFNNKDQIVKTIIDKVFNEVKNIDRLEISNTADPTIYRID